MKIRSRFAYRVWRLSSRLISLHWQYTLLRRMDDLLEALDSPETFSVDVYDARMRAVLGPFLLGRGPSQAYDDEIEALRNAMHADDVPLIEKWARETAERLIHDQVNTGSPIDVVEDLVNPLLLEFVQYYYGVPTEPEFLRQVRTCTSYIFGLDLRNGAKGHIAAVAAGRAISERIDGAIQESLAELDAGGTPAGTVMTRLLESALPAERVRDTIGGTITGTLIPTIGTFLQAIEVLLDLPEVQLGSILFAARERNYARIRRVMLEAARLRPFPSALFRFTTDNVTLRSGRRVKKGLVVMLDTTSANRDRKHVERPEVFIETRGEDQRLLFGHGQHRCVGAIAGREVAQTLLQEMATPLLALPNLRRARGKAGRLRLLGDTDHLMLEFDPPSE